MSYLEYFGLEREPFSNAPVSSFYFNSSVHSHALARLTYAVSQSKGLALLTGEAGAGKTTLSRRLLESLPEEQYEASLLVVIHSGVTPSWLLRKIATLVGVESPSDEKLTLIGQLYERLIAIHESGRRAVVLIDEAQMLQTRDIMEEFRGLLNLELPERKLLNVVLFGLPETEQYLRLDPPLFQRVAVKLRLSSLSDEGTEAYVRHRLKHAGAGRMPFTAEALQQVHRSAEGTPRVINTLCDNCLFEAFLSESPLVGESLVRKTAAELGLPLEMQPLVSPPEISGAHRLDPSPPEVSGPSVVVASTEAGHDTTESSGVPITVTEGTAEVLPTLVELETQPSTSSVEADLSGLERFLTGSGHR